VKQRLLVQKVDKTGSRSPVMRSIMVSLDAATVQLNE